jgi:hypothetical protein
LSRQIYKKIIKYLNFSPFCPLPPLISAIRGAFDTSARKMGKREARLEIKKRCQNSSFETAVVFLPEVYSDTDF